MARWWRPRRPEMEAGADAATTVAGRVSGHTAVPLVQIRHLSKSYRRGSQRGAGLTDVKLSIASGDFLAMIGPAGSGKTTPLDLIAGIRQPDGRELLEGGPGHT